MDELQKLLKTIRGVSRNNPVTQLILSEIIRKLWRTKLGLYDEKYNSDPETWLRNEFAEDLEFGQALGQANLIEGNRSAAIGEGNITRAFREIVTGSYATDFAGTPDSWVATDRHWELGNGTDADHRSYAARTYKSGYTHLNNALRIGEYSLGASLSDAGTLQYKNGYFEGYKLAKWNKIALTADDLANKDILYYDATNERLARTGYAYDSIALSANHYTKTEADAKYVVRPISSTDNAITRFNGITGAVKNSLVTINDAGSVNIPTGQTYQVNGVQISSANLSNDANITKYDAVTKTFTGEGVTTMAGTATIAKSSTVGGLQVSGTAGFPVFRVVNTNATQGDGVTTYNFSGLRLEAGNSAVVSQIIQSYNLGAQGDGLQIRTVTNNPIFFWTNNARRAFLSGVGNFVINSLIDNTVDKLQVTGSIQATTAKFTNLTDGYIPYHISDASGLGNSLMSQNSNGIGIGTEAESKLTIQPTASSGGVLVKRIGDGTGAVTWGFALQNSAASDQLIIGQTGGSFAGAISAWTGVNNSFIYYPTTLRIGVGAGSTATLALTSTGKVGVGTNTPLSTSKLDVNGEYAKQGTLLFLDPFKSDSSGAVGTILAGAGASTTHVWKTLADAGIEPAITKSTGFAKWTGSAWAFDTSTYLTAITKSMVESVLTGAITSHSHTFAGMVDDISFEFRDVVAGAQSWDLDIKAVFGYTIESAILETDAGTITGVAIKIGATAVTSLSSLTVDTSVDETASTAAKTVVSGDRITISKTGESGTPTTIRGKIKIIRT